MPTLGFAGGSNQMDARRTTRSRGNSVGSNQGEGARFPPPARGRGRGPRGRARGRGDENPPQAAQAPPADQGAPNWELRFAEMQARIEEQDLEIQRLRQQGAPAVPVPVVPVAPAPAAQAEMVVAAHRLEPLYERFRKQAPPVFLGGPDVSKAEQWLTVITRILNFMGVTGNDRVVCATFQFQEDALVWWDMVSQIHDVTTMTWERFQELFNAKYYNEAVRSAKRKEFVHLTQRENMSVTEYTTQFDRLARLASGIVPTDFSRKEKYLDGLHPKIRHDLMITTDDSTTYAQMVEKALRAEGAVGCMSESASTPISGGAPTPPASGFSRGSSGSAIDQRKRAPTASGGSSQNKRFRGNQNRGSRPGGNETRFSYPECPTCKRHHRGECKGQGCFHCGMPGHFKRECPQLRPEAPRAPAVPTPARVFAITQADADASPSVVTGKGKAVADGP
ncbi:hypothetical protein CsatA_029035 [Cannabis sativa]